MAKIAVESGTEAAGNVGAGVARNGGANDAESRLSSRALAEGRGWRVMDVVCTAGPNDRPFEERHAHIDIAIVVAGTFQYRRDAGCELMTPGSILLGNAGERFECGHEHGTGDRCLSFQFSPEYFERLAADVGGRRVRPLFGALRLPPLREFSALVARACARLSGASDSAWEELSVQIGAKAFGIAARVPHRGRTAPLPSSLARMTRVVRKIENETDEVLSLGSLAREAGLSPYHFLRSFQELTGLTPHQFVRRARLRKAAVRLAAGKEKVLDVALDSGFGDVSSFNRAFRTEFGQNPSAYRASAGLVHGYQLISQL